MGTTSALHTFILETFGGNFVYKCCLEFPLYQKMLLVLVEYSFHSYWKFIDDLLC